ncbi:tail fiber protein [Aeromonas phage 31.2]|nr:tail fiber protein [Aeromonas phage 31.2]
MADLKVGTTIGGSPAWNQGNLPLVPSGDRILYKGARVYSESDKPSADELSVLSINGGRLKGQLQIDSASDNIFDLNSTDSGAVFMRYMHNNSNKAYTGIDASGNFYVRMADGASRAGIAFQIDNVSQDITFGANLKGPAGRAFSINKGDQPFIRDHGNGNVTISALSKVDGNPGDLYLGYNSAGMVTNTVRLESPLFWKGARQLVDSNGFILRSAMDNNYYNQSEADARFIRLNNNTTTDGFILSKTAEYTDAGRNMGYSGFYRHNGVDGFSGLTMHVAHPSYSNGAYSRGITFAYGSSSYGLYTYGYDSAGVRLANQKIYTEADKPTPQELGALAAEANAVSASKLQTPRRISLSSGASGSVLFDGSGDVVIPVTIANDSHTHNIYVKKSGDIMSGNLVVNAAVDANELRAGDATTKARIALSSDTVFFQGGPIGTTGLHKIAMSGYMGKGIDALTYWMTNGVTPVVRWGSVDNKMFHEGYRPFDVQSTSLSSKSCNDALESGFYSIFGTTADTPYGTGPSGSTMVVSRWSGTGVSQTFYTYNSDRVFVRRLVGTTWNAWFELYSTSKIPTPAEVGALAVNANAVSATRLQTARLISGVPFDGTSNITITATNVGALPITGGDINGNLLVKGTLTNEGQLISYDSSTRGYGFRSTYSTGWLYTQTGKVDRDVNDQKHNLSGWYGTPLSALRFTMAEGTSPHVLWGSTSHDVLHIGKSYGVGIRQGNGASNGHIYTEDGSRDFDKLITAGRYSVDGQWLNGRAGAAAATYVGTAEVEVRAWGSGPAYIQTFTQLEGGLPSRYNRVGTGTYPNIVWASWESGTKEWEYQAGYRMMISRSGEGVYPYMTIHKADLPPTGTESVIGAWQSKIGVPPTANNPDSAQLATIVASVVDTTNRYATLRLSARDITTNGILSIVDIGKDGLVVTNGGKKVELTAGVARAEKFIASDPYAFVSSTSNTHGVYLGNSASDKRLILGGGNNTAGAVHVRPQGISTETGETVFNTNGNISNGTTPTAPAHLTNKVYVDNLIAQQVSKSGDIMTGQLTIHTANNAPLELKSTTAGVVTPQYIIGNDSTGAQRWYVGQASPNSPDVLLYSTANGTYLRLEANQISFNKNPISTASQGAAAGSLVRRDFLQTSLSSQTPNNPVYIGASANLNNYQTPGYYYQDSNANAVSGSNYPTQQAGALVVTKAAGIIQEYTVYGTGVRFIRAFYTNVWSAWATIYDSLRPPTAAAVGALPIAGGTLTGGYLQIRGSANPMLEFHQPGQVAAVIYLTSAGQLRFGTGNGAGGETAVRMTVDANGAVATIGSINGGAGVYDVGQRVYSPNNPQPSLTPTQIGNALASMSYDAVGQYAMLLLFVDKGTWLVPGTVVPGSQLRYSTAEGKDPGGAPPGNWRLHGRTNQGGQWGARNVSLWQRVS